MASDAFPADSRERIHPAQVVAQRDEATAPQALVLLLKPLASLKLTVALFAMAIFLILAGTLAQVEKDMWEVMNEYFRCYVAWIELSVFFPRSWFPGLAPIRGGFYFPGGALIGSVMAINLLSAHLLRFKTQARGARLMWGAGVTLLGVLLTWLVIASGHDHDGLQGEPFFAWSTLWTAIKVSLAGLWLAIVFAAAKIGVRRQVEFRSLCGAAVLLGGLLVWLFFSGKSVALGDSSLRILWQLIQGGGAAVVLLIGCFLVFKKRAGIVVIHGGVALLMLSELLVAKHAVEERISVEEGKTVNYARDIRTTELAIVDPSHADFDDVVVIPRSILMKQDLITHEDLPFNVEVLDYYKNADLRRVKPDESNPATAGSGLQFIAEPVRAGSGADTGGEVDLAAAYVRLSEKTSGDEIGVFLCSQIFSAQDRPEKVTLQTTVDGAPVEKTYEVALRFKRTYKPYSVHLIDVRKDDYIGTSTPRNYSSDIKLYDPQHNVDREIHIWMNNPLRYAGETFYQSGYNVNAQGVEVTDLQLVANTGWMIPYVACMIVMSGMLFHFGVTLLRFLQRREEEERKKLEGVVKAALADYAAAPERRLKKVRKTRHEPETPAISRQQGGWVRLAAMAFPLAAVALCAVWLVGKARPEGAAENGMRLDQFGMLPVVFEGRVKPLDTLARNSLRVLANKEVFYDDNGDEQPAIRWLLDSITETDAAEKHRVFRIDNMEVLDTLDLPRRKSKLYSVGELRKNIEKFETQVDLAKAKDADELSIFEKKILELDRRIRTYTLLVAAFRPLPLPPFPTEQEYNEDPQKATETMAQIRQVLMSAPEAHRILASMQPPRAVPLPAGEVEAGAEPWQPYAVAWTTAYLHQTGLTQEEPNPATMALNKILDAYERGDARTFNIETARYQSLLNDNPPEDLNAAKTRFEAFFNHLMPFYHSSVLYVFAFVLAALAWLGWSRPFNRASFWLIVLAFALHTFALIGRIYISGRPPVTNLYSSAVFIGWGAVVAGLTLERLYRLGIGNILASVAGFATLLIAYNLAGEGDTFTVLQAVLDTQFWLATHVVTITLGYTTTFVAGVLGIIYVLGGVFSPSLDAGVRRQLTRMIYGTVCFAMFFSFVGTVLGGLWADDSWGRFWGWDPKENGALIIVLWNALVLHARWDGMVKDRGLAVLAIGGNIVTSWSWFGVNELGVGLHSYGFTEGVLLTLGFFVLSQLALIGIGCLPKSMWWSYSASPQAKGDGPIGAAGATAR